MLRLRGSERVVRKPDRFVSHLHQIEFIQNLLEDRDPVPISPSEEVYIYGGKGLRGVCFS